MAMELGLGNTKGPSDRSSDLEPRAIGSGGPKGRSLRRDKGPFPPLTFSERAGNCNLLLVLHPAARMTSQE